MNLIPIADPADARIAPFRDIRERDLVGRRGHFIAEGEVVLRVLARSAHETQAILLAQKRVAALGEVLARFPAGTPVYAAPQAVLDAVAGFALHRGILALGRAAPRPAPQELLAGLPERAIVLVLFAIANHDNMGGLLRNAAGLGADAVLLDAQCCDPLYRKAIRVSVGASLLVPWARAAADCDLVALLRAHGFAPLALSPRGATPLAALKPPPRAALLLGTEGAGLPARVLGAAQTVSIPMAAGFDSLNVATAGGIVLHHLRHT